MTPSELLEALDDPAILANLDFNAQGQWRARLTTARWSEPLKARDAIELVAFMANLNADVAGPVEETIR
jgi:hypothetical protein